MAYTNLMLSQQAVNFGRNNSRVNEVFLSNFVQLQGAVPRLLAKYSLYITKSSSSWPFPEFKHCRCTGKFNINTV
jgi:hypothetical protein